MTNRHDKFTCRGLFVIFYNRIKQSKKLTNNHRHNKKRIVVIVHSMSVIFAPAYYTGRCCGEKDYLLFGSVLFD